MTKENIIRQAYEAAAERYAAVGVDAREAMDKLQKIISFDALLAGGRCERFREPGRFADGRNPGDG